jgi:hypothetical protein
MRRATRSLPGPSLTAWAGLVGRLGGHGMSALWPVPEAERGPGHRGGETVLPGPTPDPARCLPLGHLAAGLLQQHARVEARSKGNFLRSQPRASSCRGGREG